LRNNESKEDEVKAKQMTIIDTFSVVIGSAVILTMLASIALDGIRRSRTDKKKKFRRSNLFSR
jgi:hypothetical protein